MRAWSRILSGCCLAVAVAAASASGPTAPPAGPPSIAALAASPQFGRARLAPDGRHIALLRLSEQGSSLLIVDADTMQPLQEMRFKPHEHVAWFDWANADTLVLTRSRHLAGHEGPIGSGELFAVSVDGHRRDYLYGFRAGASKRNKGRSGDRGAAWVVDTLPTDPRRVLIVAYRFSPSGVIESRPHLLKLDVYSGAREDLGEVPLAFPAITTDLAGEPRFATGRDRERRMHTLQRDHDGQWQPLELGLGVNGVFQPLQFEPDGRLLATISEAGEPGCLYRVRLEDMQRERLTCEARAELERLLPSSRPGVPTAALYTAGGRRAHLLDPALPEARLFKTLSASFAPASVEFYGFSKDGGRLLFGVLGDREPGRLYLYDDQAHENRLLFARQPALAGAAFGSTHPFELTARDGTPLSGFVTLPPAAEPKQLPLIVLPHGGPYGVHDDGDFDRQTQLLATRGYAVLKINYRGSNGFGAAFERQGYRQWGGAIQDDIVDATQWAIEHGLADPARICIVGASFGGYSALMSAARSPSLFRCAVGVAGVYDLDMLFQRGDLMRSDWGRAYLHDVIGDDETLRSEQSPLAQAERIRAAVLLVHGTADRRAPVAHERQLAEALAEHGHPAEVLEIEDEGHGFFRARHREQYYTRLLQFLDRQIGPQASAQVDMPH